MLEGLKRCAAGVVIMLLSLAAAWGAFVALESQREVITWHEALSFQVGLGDHLRFLLGWLLPLPTFLLANNFLADIAARMMPSLMKKAKHEELTESQRGCESQEVDSKGEPDWFFWGMVSTPIVLSGGVGFHMALLSWSVTSEFWENNLFQLEMPGPLLMMLPFAFVLSLFVLPVLIKSIVRTR